MVFNFELERHSKSNEVDSMAPASRSLKVGLDWNTVFFYAGALLKVLGCTKLVVALVIALKMESFEKFFN